MVDEIAAPEPQKDEYLQKFEERQKDIDQSYKIVHTVAQKITNEARRQNGGEPQPLDWDSWHTAQLEPGSPIRLGDLKTEFPELVEILETPSGPTEVRRDLVDDDTKIISFGDWRNPSVNQASLKFDLIKDDDPPGTIRNVSFQAGYNLGRDWFNPSWMVQQELYIDKGPEIRGKLMTAMEQTGALVDKVMQGEHSANYSSYTEEVGKAYWEK